MESPVLEKLSVTEGQEKSSSYGDYHREYYQKNKAKIWEKVKASDAYKEKYRRYYQKHKELLNKKRTERLRAKREQERAEVVITTPCGHPVVDGFGSAKAERLGGTSPLSAGGSESENKFESPADRPVVQEADRDSFRSVSV